MSSKSEQRRLALNKLVAEYEKALGSTIHVGPTFDTSRLPQPIAELVDYTAAKTPSFSNIAATTAVCHALAHTIGQARPYIDDLAFSSDHIGVNFYGVAISGSGAGKSSTTNGLLKLFKPALELVNEERLAAAKLLARKIALAEAQATDKDFTEDQITDAMIEPFLQPLSKTTATFESTRGGLTKLLSKLSQEEYSTLSLIADELGMSLKANNTVNEVLQLLTSNFDMGIVEAPEFKGEEYKETSVEGIYINMLAHSSPKVIFGDRIIADRLAMFYATSGARRTWFVFPDSDETDENNEVPTEIAAARALTESRRLLVNRAAPAISDNITAAVERLLTNQQNRAITFTPDAAILYEDYKDYCTRRAELMEDSSITQIELAGRAFKLGKLAGIWALAQQTSQITKETLASTIYLAEYAAKYLEKFVRLTTANPWELLAEEFISGKSTHITLDQAITSGYIKKVTKDFAELMEPLNSLLRTEGVCIYDKDVKTFVYTKFNKVETQPTTTTEPVCTFTASYTLVPGMSKDDRLSKLESFDKFRDDLCYDNIINLLSRDTIFNTFKFDSGPSKDNPDIIIPHRRRQEHVISSTNLVVLDIDHSDVPLDVIHEFLESYQHLISTTSNKENRNKFRIVLPINIHLDGRNKKQYAYVTSRIAADLLVTMDPLSKNVAQPWYGYQDAEVLTNTTGKLYDVTHYLTDFAKDEEAKPAINKQIAKSRSPKARKAHVDKLLDNAAKEFEYAITAPDGEGNIRLAWLANRCIEEGFTATEYEMLLRYVVDLWDYPLPEDKLQRNHIDQFAPKMHKETK